MGGEGNDVILLHKKGDRKNLSNYRPTSIAPIISKVYTKIVKKKRIFEKLDSNQPWEQTGFRKKKKKSTINHLFGIK